MDKLSNNPFSQEALEEAAGCAPQEATSNTHFVFQHKCFEVPGAVFRMNRAEETVALHLNLGGAAASVDLQQLAKTFNIHPEEPDGLMLDMVRRGLRYVREIRPGDSIPNELLDGTASWSIDPMHYERAHSKLLVQLVNWMTAGSSAIDNAADVLRLIEKPEIKEKINDAFSAAAQQLGLRDNGKDQVIAMIGQLANELAYIEALRDKVNGYFAIKRKLKDLASAYRSDRRVAETIDRANTLLNPPLTKLREQLQLVDGQTAEILSSLRRLKATIQYLRDSRDSLREFVVLWHDLDTAWAELRVERNSQAEALIARTYRFAATHYSMTQRWAHSVA